MKKILRPTRSIMLLVLVLLLVGFVYAQTEPATDAGEHVVKVLRTTNKAQVQKFVPRVYDFQKTNPHQVINYFTTALATEEGGAYTFVAPDGKSGKILVICPEHQIPYFDKIAKELDRPEITSSPGSKYIYYRLKHRSAGDLSLLNVLSNYGGELPVVTPDSSRPGQALQADFETNSILLFDAPSGADNAQKILEEVLDKPTPQVEIQVKIYEVQLNDNGAFGLDYTDWKNGPGALLFNFERGGERLRKPDEFFSNQWSHTGGYYIDYPSAYFDFLVVKNKARVVTESSVAAMSNSSASFESSEQFLYFSKTYAGTSAPTPVQNQNIDGYTGTYYREVDMVLSSAYAGVWLWVLPTIGEENVDMKIEMDVDNVTGFADGDGYRDKPIVSCREFEDRINVPLNKEVVITGLTRDRVINNTKKIPILGSIPVLGWFFGGESARTDKTMVVAVLKAVPIKDMDNYTEEHKLVMDKAQGEASIIPPSSSVGFDQWLLDSEK